MITDFKPDALFISTGEKTAMYTLRYAGIATAFYGRQMVKFRHSYHIKNLSTDSATAQKKAQDYSDSIGLPINSGADFDLNEIKRRNSAEEIERNRAFREAVEKAEIEYQKKCEEEYVENVAANAFLIGKYVGMSVEQIAEIDPEYIRWIASKFDDEESPNKFKASTKVAKNWADSNPEPISEWVGEVGEKIEFTATVTKRIAIETGFGLNRLFRLKDVDGNILITFSNAKSMVELDVGNTVVIKATVKRHERSQYEREGNDKVTNINRPKVVG